MASKPRQAGFTVVELMIAVAVFSVAITLITTGVLHIGRQYQQASSRTRLESAARDVHQQVAQSVQFAGGTVSAPLSAGGWTTQCIGNQQYTYATQPASLSLSTYNAMSRGLFIRTNNTGLCVVAVPGANDRNLLPTDAVVIGFLYDPVTTSFTTNFVRSEFDLLEVGPPVRCKAGVAGNEYCAAVSLTSSFTKRVNN